MLTAVAKCDSFTVRAFLRYENSLTTVSVKKAARRAHLVPAIMRLCENVLIKVNTTTPTIRSTEGHNQRFASANLTVANTTGRNITAPRKLRRKSLRSSTGWRRITSTSDMRSNTSGWVFVLIEVQFTLEPDPQRRVFS